MADVFPPTALRPVLDELSALLQASPSPIKIAVAETSTGGLISAALLSIPGASRWYVGGATLYTRESRRAWAGWTDEHLKTYLGPTEEIVVGLASKVGTTLGATHTIGESGTAGPTAPGAQFVNSVVGQVSLAVVSGEGAAASRTVKTGLESREGNMVTFSVAALELLRDVLKGDAVLEKREEGGSRL
ncbi:hypothetical protein PLICRDRAFT_157243 [Plicaturopsis crispa FD-325 SS-3]|nr:hypothetical protein PLICRDRAFT_157243 [Plicaturopsis crispa FD-325 SS-3]